MECFLSFAAIRMLEYTDGTLRLSTPHPQLSVVALNAGGDAPRGPRTDRLTAHAGPQSLVRLLRSWASACETHVTYASKEYCIAG